MKKIMMAAIAAFMLSMPAQAQDVLKELMKTNTAICQDSTQSLETRRIAAFKIDELTYMRSRVAGDILSNPNDLKLYNDRIKLLNEQSLAMNQYIAAYQSRMKDCKDKAVVNSYFIKATLDCPLFNDKDAELVRSYVDRSDYPVRFALDCDWKKALSIIRNIDWSQF